MPTSIRSLVAATFLAGTTMVATPAFAQGPVLDDITISGNVAIVTDYRFRGVSFSGGDLAIQGGIDAVHDSGFYVGTWASSIDGGPAFGEVELDLYGGWSGEVSPGLTFDAGLLYYVYPSGDTGADTDYFEPYASLSTTLGPVGARVGVAYAWEQDSLGGADNLYVYTDIEAGIPNTPVTVFAHLGYSDGVLTPDVIADSAGSIGNFDSTGLDYAVGASATVFNNLTVGVSYVGVEGTSVEGLTDDTIVGTLAVGF